MSFFDTVIVQPIFNLLMLIYSLIPDFGVSIIIFTILVRLLSRTNAVAISQNHGVIAALSKNDFNEIKKVLDDLNKNLKADTISITDTQGNVVIRQHKPEKSGDNILKQKNVQKALKGEIATSLEPGTLVKLSCRTGAPIYDKNGDIIGSVVTGYSFEKETIVDSQKDLHNMEFSIFAGDERISTTIMQNGKRYLDSKLEEKYSKTVLEKGESYLGVVKILGKSYYAKYIPIKDAEGKSIGIIFAGLPKDLVVKSTLKSIFRMILVVVIILGICVFIISKFVTESIKKPMNKLKNVSDMLSKGNLNVDIQTFNSKKDEITLLSASMQDMVLQLKSYISDITSLLSSMANKDFTVKSEVDYIGDFVPIQTAMSTIIKSFNDTLMKINSVAEQVSSGADQVSTATQSLATGATQQAATVQQLSDSIDKIALQAEENASSVRTAAQYVEQTGKGIDYGNNHMEQLTSAMKEIGESSEEIVNITKVIEGYAVERKIFTDRDIAALLMGLGSIAAMSGPEGTYARAKIMSLLPEDWAREVALKSGQVVIDPTPWMGRDRTGPLLERIRTAMDEGRLVAFRYSDRKGLESERRVEPHRLVLKEGRWYLHGFCLEREDFRLFKLARMAGLQILEAAFEFREVPRSHSGFSDAMTHRETRITLRVQEALRDRLLDYCGPEDIRDYCPHY